MGCQFTFSIKYKTLKLIQRDSFFFFLNLRESLFYFGDFLNKRNISSGSCIFYSSQHMSLFREENYSIWASFPIICQSVCWCHYTETLKKYMAKEKDIRHTIEKRGTWKNINRNRKERTGEEGSHRLLYLTHCNASHDSAGGCYQVPCKLGNWLKQNRTRQNNQTT